MTSTAVGDLFTALLEVRDPVRGNPFPTGSAAHVAWHQATELVQRTVREHRTALLASVSSPGADASSLAERTAHSVGFVFDAWAMRGLMFVRDLESKGRFVTWLREYGSKVQRVHQELSARLGAPEVLMRVQIKLAERVLHWQEKAESHLESKATIPSVSRAAPSTSRGVVAPRKGTPEYENLVANRRVLIKDQRELRGGLSIKDFAKSIGMSQDSIKGIVREDRKRFSAASQQRLLKSLNISLDRWYTGVTVP